MKRVMKIICAALVGLFFLGCRVHGYIKGDGKWLKGEIYFDGYLNPCSMKPKGEGIYMGSGYVVFENRDVILYGNFYDTDGDLKPDKFEPTGVETRDDKIFFPDERRYWFDFNMGPPVFD